MSSCYVYAIKVDGIIRYIGRGRARRLRHHEATARKRLLLAAAGHTLKPHKFYDNLASAMSSGCEIVADIIVPGLTGDEAQIREMQEISARPRDQLWNSIFSETPRIVDADVIAKLSAAARRSNGDPNVRAKIAAGVRAANAQDETLRKRKSIGTANNWQDPAVRARRSSGISAVRTTPAQRAITSKQSAALWELPDHRARMSARQRELWRDPEYREAMSRRRVLKGEERWNAKLSDAQIACLRGLAANGAKQVDLAREFGVRPAYVSRVLSGARRK